MLIGMRRQRAQCGFGAFVQRAAGAAADAVGLAVDVLVIAYVAESQAGCAEMVVVCRAADDAAVQLGVVANLDVEAAAAGIQTALLVDAGVIGGGLALTGADAGAAATAAM